MAQQSGESRHSRQQESEAHEISDEELKAAKDIGTTAFEGANEDVDDLLAEIDEVLESNAEDFVRSYIQKGGE